MRQRPNSIALMVIFAIVFALPMPAQQKPFTQDQVQGMVSSGLGDDSGAKLIEQRGVDFAPSEEFLQRLKTAGANETFLAAVRTAKPPAPAGGAGKKPLNQVQVFALLTGQVPSHRVAMLVQERGIDFQPTVDYLQEIRLAGGDEELIALLRNAPTRHPAPTVPPAANAAATLTPPTPATATGVLDMEGLLGATPEGKSALAQKDQTRIDEIDQKLIRFVTDFAQRNNYAYILDSKKTPVYYLSPRLDLTEKLEAAFVSGSAAPSAEAPASQPAGASEPQVVAVIDFDRAVSSTLDGKSALAALQKKYQPRQQEFQRTQQEIQALQNQLQKQVATTLSKNESSLSREVKDKQDQLNRDIEDAQHSFQRDGDELMKRIGGGITLVVEESARQNGYALVMDEVKIPFYYVEKDLDITQDTVKRYDAKGRAETPNASPRSLPARRVAFININEAIAGTIDGKNALADLQKKYQPLQQELQRLQQEKQAIQDQLQKQQPTLSDQEQSRLLRELETKQKQFTRAWEDAQADFNRDRDEVINRIGTKMLQLIAEYAGQNNFGLVLDDVQVPVYYASKDIEMTDAIIKRYDAATPAASSPAPGR